MQKYHRIGFFSGQVTLKLTSELFFQKLFERPNYACFHNPGV